MSIEDLFAEIEELATLFRKTPKHFQERFRDYMKYKQYESFFHVPPEERKEIMALFKKNEEKS